MFWGKQIPILYCIRNKLSRIVSPLVHTWLLKTRGYGSAQHEDSVEIIPGEDANVFVLLSFVFRRVVYAMCVEFEPSDLKKRLLESKR